MLVLSRQRDETIMIGDEIEITVVDIRGDKVRLGINAPTRIAVHRKEVYEAIRKENEQAARLVSPPGSGTDLSVIKPGPALGKRLGASRLSSGPAPGTGGTAAGPPSEGQGVSGPRAQSRGA